MTPPDSVADADASIGRLTASTDATLNSTLRPARRWLRPRFSLAAALAVVTLVSVGLWFWYRLPFQVEQRGLRDVMGMEYHFAPPKLSPRPAGQMCVRRVAWYRRSASSEPILHGERLSYDAKDLLIGRDQWRDGVRHGLWQSWYSDGHVREQGAYYLGRKDGPWTAYRQDDGVYRTAPHFRYHRIASNWRRGVPDGIWEYRDHQDQLVQRLEFRSGKLIDHDDLPITPRLAAAMAERSHGNASFVEQLFQPVSARLGDCQLYAAVSQLGKTESVGQVIANRHRDLLSPDGDWDLLIAAQPGAAPVKLSKLQVHCEIKDQPGLLALTQLLTQHNLVVDYRFGDLWVTTPENAVTWRDTSGVADLRPPRGSHLAQIWNERYVSAGFVYTPLTDVCDFFSEHYRVKIDLKAPPNKLVTASSSGTFAEILGMTLDRTGCRCSLQGETLVIEDLPVEPQ